MRTRHERLKVMKLVLAANAPTATLQNLPVRKSTDATQTTVPTTPAPPEPAHSSDSADATDTADHVDTPWNQQPYEAASSTAPNTPSPRPTTQKPASEKSAGNASATPTTPHIATPPPQPAPAATPPLRSRPGRLVNRPDPAPSRLVSLDAFRGFIMMMLAASGFGLLAFSKVDPESPVWQSHDHALWQRIGFHFDHPAWASSFNYWQVSFWDLIQPAFMFMVGVSMPFSYARRESRGAGWLARAAHALSRSVILVLLGVFLYSMRDERTNWIFPNVLCQIGLGYFFAWLLLNRHASLQFAALALILIGYWGWFKLSPPPADFDYQAVSASADKGEIFEGPFAPWSKNSNAAAMFDAAFLPLLRNAPVAPAENPEQAALPTGHARWRLAALTGNPAAAANMLQAGPPTTESTETIAPSTTDTPSTSDPPALPAFPPPTPDPTPPAPAEINAPEPVAVPATRTWYQQWFFSNTTPWEPNSGGYTTLNFIPSIGTTLLGILCGQWLLSTSIGPWKKLGYMLSLAIVCFGLGIAANLTVCPIVKRIWTPSWVLFSGGYVIAMLSLFYLAFDILPLKILAFPLVVVGTNSILIYMLGQTISGWMRDHVVRVHLSGFLTHVFGPHALDPLWYGTITLPTTVFLLYWLFLLWLYRQKIFLRI